jgi:hypothetical protein
MAAVKFFGRRMAAGASALAAAVLVLALPTSNGTAQPKRAHPPEEQPAHYPDGPNREETFYFCTACHGFKLVAQQGMTRAQWEDSINLMVRRHNMPPLDDKDRDTVLNYLEAAYPPRAPAARGGWVNPFAK